MNKAGGKKGEIQKRKTQKRRQRNLDFEKHSGTSQIVQGSRQRKERDSTGNRNCTKNDKENGDGLNQEQQKIKSQQI